MLQNKAEIHSASDADPIHENPELSPEDAQALVPEKPKKKRKKAILLAAAVVLVAAAGATLLFGSKGQQAANGASYTNHTIEARDITLSLSGTGTLNPASSYTVTTLISGDILSAPFEEGDIVEKDTVLFEVDSADAASSIEQAEIALSQSQRSYAQKVKSLQDLQIKANESGTIVALSIEAGDKVSVGQEIAQIRNSAVMSLEIPFGTDDVAGFYVGQSAEVTLDSTFERLSGTIAEISPVEERLEGNMLVRSVTIDVANPGGIAADGSATAMVGNIACNGSGTFTYKAESALAAETTGEVAAIHAKAGDAVRKNEVIVTLTSDALSDDIANSADSLHGSEISLQSKYDQLDDYIITAPIAGTIIEKNYKEGDTLEGGKALCTIFDLSYLTMTLDVDELDVSKVAAGQEVAITAEALAGQSYRGIVTKVNINGRAAEGVTSYPVTIRIDETDGLLPGMNVQAAIVVSESKDTVAIPVGALVRGNRVLAKKDSAAAMPDGTPPSGMTAALPEGFTYVQVTPGISDGDYIEIMSGLDAGDIVAYLEETIPEAAEAGFGPGGGTLPGGEGGFPAGGQAGSRGARVGEFGGR